MIAYIDDITIVGTPEEIQEFIELRKYKESSGSALEVKVEPWINGKPNFTHDELTYSGTNLGVFGDVCVRTK